MRIKVNLYHEILPYNTIIGLKDFTTDKMLAYLFVHSNFSSQWQFWVILLRGQAYLSIGILELLLQTCLANCMASRHSDNTYLLKMLVQEYNEVLLILLLNPRLLEGKYLS